MAMKIFPLLLVALTTGLAVGQANLGTCLSSAMVPKNNATECAATPSQTYACVQNVQIDGVRFTTVGYDSRTRRIKYLFTQDDKFKTSDGLQVNSLISLAENEISSVKGWHTIGPRTRDGWRPILGILLDGNFIESADGEAIDLTKPVAGKTHRFKIIGFDKGGV